MISPNILIFSGSTRSASTNQKLAGTGLKALSQLDCQPTMITLADYALPLYNGDLEDQKGVPENAKKLARLFHEHHGFLIASPEYNGSVTPLLKNTIDWISRVSADAGGPVSPFRGKFAGLIAASPGMKGGIGSLTQLRPILTAVGVLVITEQLTIAHSANAFDPMDELADARSQRLMADLCQSLVEKCTLFNLR